MSSKFTAEASDFRGIPKLEVTRIGSRWWIDGLDELMGPYTTRAEAEKDKRGMERFYHRAFGPKGKEFVCGPKNLE